MSLLNEVVPVSSFELIRDKIGAILAEEINHQFLISYDPEIQINTVWVERFIPFSKTELPTINVTVASGTYDSKDMKHAVGTYTYNIEIYSSSKTSEDDRGDVQAKFKLHKLMRICRAILENPRYKYLGFDPVKIISRRYVQDIVFAQGPTQDADNTIMGMLTFIVIVPETNELINPPLLAGHDTSWKIQQSDKGYFYTIN